MKPKAIQKHFPDNIFSVNCIWNCNSFVFIFGRFNCDIIQIIYNSYYYLHCADRNVQCLPNFRWKCKVYLQLHFLCLMSYDSISLSACCVCQNSNGITTPFAFNFWCLSISAGDGSILWFCIWKSTEFYSNIRTIYVSTHMN